jgi:hypothetical protein
MWTRLDALESDLKRLIGIAEKIRHGITKHANTWLILPTNLGILITKLDWLS